MARVKQGNLVGVSGRVDNMILYTKKKETFMRKVSTKEPPPRSEAQKTQNTRLSSVVTLYQSIKNTLLDEAWRMEASRQDILSGYNLFVRMNLKAYSKNYTVGDFMLLTLSAGTLQLPFQLRQREITPGTCSLGWEASPWMPTPRISDKLMAAVIYDNEPYRVEIIENTGATRYDGEATFPLSSPGASEAHVYCFFTNKDTSNFTNSVYFNVKLS